MGKVYLIGAGPGDPGLYTIKAKEIISIADAIVYDYLANEVFLEWIKDGCEVIYAGKKGGDHTLSQDEINELLVKLGKKYDVVVRLKGGDPYIFGRGGEEAEFLVENGLEFEVVPGVSSAVAAPAYAGIPLTHRDFSSSVTFVTGHEASTKKSSVIEWDKLARSASTLVFFMGVKNLPQITKNLISAGLSKDTKAALVRWGTTCRQKSVVSTLENISQVAKKENITPPALLVVGDVVSLKDKLSWFEKKPLLGKNIVITRARAQASDLLNLLREYGACCIQLPTIEIKELSDYSHLYSEFNKLHTYDFIIFTSVNGVDLFFDKLFKNNMDVRAIGKSKIVAIGPATARKLKNFGIIPDIVPEKFIAESIVEKLKQIGVSGKNILIPRAKQARDVLIKELEKSHAKVVVVPVYETTTGDGDVSFVKEKIKRDEIDFITFTSSSTVKNFFKLIPPQFVSKYGHNIKFACIGPITAKTLKEYGFNTDIMPDSYTIKDLVLEILKYVRENS